MNWIEWVGYLGATLVVLSFLIGKNNLRRLRIINLLGALAFIAYGILLNMNLPIIIPNVFIACIQSYYLFIKRSNDEKKAE